ncbi:hypothetical protein H4R33_005563 [Dimargaris cristalligena]|nr:hypothetical protein H4R33_005563 [Dimargaris cristalligena]
MSRLLRSPGPKLSSTTWSPLISLLDLPPNARVLEAGTGMGALTMHLARIAAHVDTVELRLDHYRKAQKFIAQFQRGHLLPRIRFHHGSLDQLIHHSMTQVQAQAQVEARTDNKPELEPELASSSPTTPSLLSTTQFDGVVLDLPTPWSLLAAVLPVLKSDHFIICYLPNLTQVLDLHQYILARPALRCRVAVDATWEVEWKEWEIHPTLVRNPTPHPEQLNTYWDEAVGKGNATDHPPNGASNGNRSSDNENPGGDQPIEPKEEPATHAWVCHPSRMPKGHTAFLVRLKKIETIDSKVKNGNREE